MGGDCPYHVPAAPVSGFFPEGTKNRMPMDKGNKDSEGVKNGYLLKQKTHCQEGWGFQSQVVSELVTRPFLPLSLSPHFLSPHRKYRQTMALLTEVIRQPHVLPSESLWFDRWPGLMDVG